MHPLDILYPVNKFTIDWSKIDGKFAWFERLAEAQQDLEFHREGDAKIHTKMVCEELVKNDEFRLLHPHLQKIMFATCAMHDISKPVTTYVDENGRIKTKNHCGVGAIMAREELYKMGVPFGDREIICPIIKNHLKPFFLIDYDNPKRIALKIAASTRLDLLKIQAIADIKGRICNDAQKILDNIDLYYQFCQEAGLLENHLPFANAHSRFVYFRNESLLEPYEAFHDKRCEVIVMSGLPGAGKDHWIEHSGPDWPVVSLDAIRRERKIKPTDNQKEIISAAHEIAKEHLRKKQNFIWSATNISQQIRGEVIDLLANYNAHVKIVYVETPYKKYLEQNQNREYVVPEAAIERIMRKWQVPDTIEAHEIEYVINS